MRDNVVAMMHESASLFNRGNKFLEKKNPEKALQFYKKSLRVREVKETYLNMGNCYKMMGWNKEAIDCYKKAADYKVPTANNEFMKVYNMAESNLGLMEYAIGDDDTALQCYSKVLNNNPNAIDTSWNAASAMLRKWCNGEEVDLSLAWKLYECRFIRTNTPTPIFKGIPRWDGITRGDKIVVLAEQGFGDKIMFGRYIHKLREYFKEVWVQCNPELEMIYKDFKTCQDPRVSGASVSVPLCSLGMHFMPEVPPGDWLRGRFGNRLNLMSPFELNVAVEWKGSSTHANDRFRSCSSHHFCRLPGIKMYNLRPDSINIKNIERLPVKDWGDTIEWLNSMDLVISIDTSLVHMAGSLGVETWMIQPSQETDFRWGRSEMGEKNIWYDDIRVIRNDRNWDAAFARVEELLISERERLFMKKAERLVNAANS